MKAIPVALREHITKLYDQGKATAELAASLAVFGKEKRKGASSEALSEPGIVGDVSRFV